MCSLKGKKSNEWNKHWIPLWQETEKKDEASKYHSPQYDMATICITEGAVSETKFWPNR